MSMMALDCRKEDGGAESYKGRESVPDCVIITGCMELLSHSFYYFPADVSQGLPVQRITLMASSLLMFY